MSNHWLQKSDRQEARAVAVERANYVFAMYEDEMRKLAEEAATNFFQETNTKTPEKDMVEPWLMAAEMAILCAFDDNRDRWGVWTSQFNNVGYIANVRIMERPKGMPGHPYTLGVSFQYSYGAGTFR